MSYRFLPHTADLRAALDAPSLDALYATSVVLIRETLVGQSAVAGREERVIPWEHTDPSERFFRFVRELLYLYDTDQFVPATGEPRPDGVAVRGERFDPKRHESHHQVKALTRHGFVFEQGPEGYRAELVFDL